MECRNCSFQNTPGLAVCVRCQSRLDLSGVEYQPPRARGSPAWRGLARRLRAWSNRADERIERVTQRLHATVHPDVDLPTLLWSVIPGLGHLRRGQRFAGWSFLVAWFVLLLLALANIGTGRGWVLGLGAVGFHCMVVALLLARSLAGQPALRRLQVGFLTYLALVGFVYGPPLLVARQIARFVPLQGIRPNSLLANGDVIVCTSTWTRPGEFKLGELVVYQQGRVNRPVLRVEEGLGVDRIVALPGEHVSWDGTELRFTGLQQERVMPLGGLSGIPPFRLSIGAHQYGIIPSVLDRHVHGDLGALGGLFSSVACVEESDIVGRVWWRLRPWGRFGPVGGVVE